MHPPIVLFQVLSTCHRWRYCRRAAADTLVSDHMLKPVFFGFQAGFLLVFILAAPKPPKISCSKYRIPAIIADFTSVRDMTISVLADLTPCSEMSVLVDCILLEFHISLYIFLPSISCILSAGT